MLKVKKRDGYYETWSSDKLITSMGRAGVPIEDAQKFADEIYKWALQASTDGIITSTSLREKVIDLIKKDYPTEAENYKTYKKGSE